MAETHQIKLESPSLELIAAFVRFSRQLAGWKKATLASVAAVSLSTVERVERGDLVSPASLERLAVALKQERGAFTRPRRPHTTEAAMAAVNEQWDWIAETVPVDMVPLRTQAQLRALSASVTAIVTHDLEDEATEDIAALTEWLEVVSFRRAEHVGLFTTNPPRERNLSRLDGDVLTFVGDFERRRRCVCLVGTYCPKTDLTSFQGAVVGLVGIRSKLGDPAAAGQKTLLAPSKFDFSAALAIAFAEDVPS